MDVVVDGSIRVAQGLTRRDSLDRARNVALLRLLHGLVAPLGVRVALVEGRQQTPRTHAERRAPETPRAVVEPARRDGHIVSVEVVL